jgi:tRNA pseudouridine55 synthase
VDNQQSKFDFRTGELLLVDKPIGWTSFDVVAKLRNAITRFERHFRPDLPGRIKVGHSGTLDPLATGLLIIATGKKTKELESFQGLDKSYSATIKLGAETASYDAETAEENIKTTDHITAELLEVEIQKFRGAIAQKPPIFSAVKVEGVRLYQHARVGEVVERPTRYVTIYKFELEKINLPEIEADINCSKGTYIRSIAHDLGQELNTGAYLTALRRTSVGDFFIEQAWQLDELLAILEKREDAK